MSGRHPPKQPTGGAGGRSSSKESLKKPAEKPPTTRKMSSDRGGHSGRGGATSLPSSPHNPRQTTATSTKKSGLSVTPRKDVVVKGKGGKPLQKEAAAEMSVGDFAGDIEGPGPSGGIPFKRLHKGVETGQFERRAPTEVKPVAFRPELSPRSQRVHNSACKFLAVKREECNDQKRMETFIMEMFPKLQRTLQKVHELSRGASRFQAQLPAGGDDIIREENDKLNHEIAKAGSVFREFDGLLTQTRERVLAFISRAEKGTQDIDDALRDVINDICNYSKVVKDDDRPEGLIGGDEGGKPDDGDDDDDQDGKPGDGPEGKSEDGGDQGGKPGDGSGGDQGGKPGDGSGGDQGGKPRDGSGGDQGDKPGDGSGGDQGDKPGDGSGGDQEGKPGDGSGDRSGGSERNGNGDGSGGDQGDGSGGDQGGKPGGSVDGKKHVDEHNQPWLEDDYDSVISPSASESEPEFEDDIHEEDYGEYTREMVDALVPTMVTVTEGVKKAFEHPGKVPEVLKHITKTVDSSMGPFKGFFKNETARKLVECLTELDPDDPQATMMKILTRFVDISELSRPNAESKVEGIDGLMDAVKARLEENVYAKNTISSETQQGS